jgi:hypothetical protein
VDAEDQAPGAEEHLASARARSLVLKALASLPEKQRTLIVMHDLDGASMREIADTLAVPLFTAYSRLRSARQAFAKSVRRLHTLAQATAGLERVPSPESLLRTERVPPPAPPQTRRRTMSRVRAMAALPMPLPTPMPATPAPRLLPFGVAAGVAATVGVLALAIPTKPGNAPRAVRAPGPTRAPTVSVPESKLASRPPPGLATAAAGLSKGLVGYWHLDDGSGSGVARDASGRGNDCQLRNLDPSGDWTDGPLAGALSLNGRGWLECGQVRSSWAQLSDAVTVAGWVKRGAASRRLQTLVSRQKGSDREDYFLLGFGGENLMFSSNVWDARVLHPLPAGDHWVHVAGTRSPDGMLRLFINGEQVAYTLSKRMTKISGGANPVVIGGGVNVAEPQPTELLQAQIDEVVVYDRALGPNEIHALASGVQPAQP